jgi:hypothetical protein
MKESLKVAPLPSTSVLGEFGSVGCRLPEPPGPMKSDHFCLRVGVLDGAGVLGAVFDGGTPCMFALWVPLATSTVLIFCINADFVPSFNRPRFLDGGLSFSAMVFS